MPLPLKVLLAEDNPNDAELVIRALRQAGFEPTWLRVETEEEFLAHLSGDLDIVLSDFRMPRFNGFRALELLKARELDIPFILVSGTIGEDMAVEAMRRGATDYLLKDRLARLGSAVNHAIAERRRSGDRRKTDETLRVTNAQLNQMLEHSPAVLYVMKLDGEKVVPHRVSGSIGSLLGFTALEALSSEWWLAQLHPDDRERASKNAAETLRTGASRTEYRMCRKDGRYCWLEDTQRLVRDAAGEPVELIGVWTDITERKRAEETMRQASGDVARGRRKRMRIEVAILVAATVTVYLIGYFSSWFEFVTHWFLARPVEHMDELILTTVFVAASLAIFAYRRWRETELEMTSNQQVQAALALLHDELDRQVRQRTGELNAANRSLREEIGERRRTTEALVESEEQFRQVVENMHEVFWIMNPLNGKVLYVSPTYEKIWGRSCESAYSVSHFGLDFIQPEDQARIQRARSDKEAQGTYDVEFRIVRPDGSTRWIHDRAFPVRDAAGDLHRIVGVAEDITERKQLEEQYRQAQKMEAIGTLAGGIAHDFNNILTAIIGYTELASMIAEGNSKLRVYLGAVIQAASRATGLIRQILTFSRQQPQERLPIKLPPIVEETIKLLRATIPTTIEFDTSIAADSPTVLADANQIHQILMNLGTNAWYAMKSRTGRLQIRLENCVVDEAMAAAHPSLRPGLHARISVSDTGCGMDKETLRRVFEPFFTTKPPGEGTGLGLAVVHGIMDSHDGTVTVSSAPGEGTTFSIYFPAYEGEAIPPPVKEGPVPRGNGERILVVDDEEVLALLAQRALTALGYEAEFATQPTAALDMVRDDPQRFALVITDQTMPSMTGLLLASQIRQIRPGLPVIMMTGYTAPLMADRVASAGIRELLLKPITIRALGVAVKAALSVPSPPRPGPESPPTPPIAGPPPAEQPPQPVCA
jgi:PAS domain S-box-containing protein